MLESVFACLHGIMSLYEQKPLKCMVTLCEACVQAIQVIHHTTTLFTASLAHETIVYNCMGYGVYDQWNLFR